MRSFVSLSLVLLLPTPPIPQQPSLPTIKVDTKLTIVDVTVTDKYGHPVHGLTQSDFTIKEDNKPQPTRNFDEYGTTIAPAAAPPPVLPPNTYSNQTPPAPTTSAVNILLFDEVNTGMNLSMQPELFIYSKLQAEKYLKDLPPGTRVAIMVSSDNLRLVQDFTTDKEVLRAEVNKLLYMPAFHTTFIPTGHDTMSSVMSIADRRSLLTLNSLRQAAAFTAGIPGRKNIVWFTAGIPWLTNYPRFMKYDLHNYTEELQETYGLLNASRAAVYTIDSHGVRNAVSAASASGAVDPPWPGILPPEQHALDNESISDIAEATGGIPYYNRNDLDTITGEAIASGSDYYAISYTPPLKGYDGKYHTINVQVNKPGLHVQYRKGYTSLDLSRLNNAIELGKSKTAAANTVDPTAVTLFRTGMAHGAAPTTQLLLAAHITPALTPSQAAPPPTKGELNPKVKANPLIRYDVLYTIPGSQLTLTEAPNGARKASVEFDVVAYGEDGTKLNVLRQTANVTLKPEGIASFQQRPFQVPLQLDLPPGKLFVRVGALDVPSGKSGTLEVQQTVAKP